jgi:hypothetical protein
MLTEAPALMTPTTTRPYRDCGFDLIGYACNIGSRRM